VTSKKKKKGKFILFLESYFIFVLIFIFGCLYTYVGITKYLHYETGLDIAIYVQTMWFYTHFKLPYVTLFPTYGDLVWADHFTPSLMLLAPFYMLWKDPRMLIILQAFIFVFGAFPIYKYAKEKIKSNFFALSLAFVFLTYFGTQFPLTFDFHAGTMAAAFMAWILWAMVTNKWKTFIILCIIAAGVKEDMPLYLATIALYLVVSKRNWKLGLIMLPLFLGYAYVVTEKVMPHLAHDAAKVFSLSYFNLSPDYLLSVFFDSPVKIRTMLLSFSNLLFLPFLSRTFLLLPLAHFFINFSNPDFPGRWDIYLHYRGYSAAMMLFATILGYLYLMKKKPKLFDTTRAKKIVAILLIINALVFAYFLHLPLNVLSKKQFYHQESWIHDNDEVIKKIPADAYLLTLNNLAPQTAFREHIYYYPQNIEKAEYVFIDTRLDQPIINYWITADNKEEYASRIETVLKSNDFKIIYQRDNAVLLKRMNL